MDKTIFLLLLFAAWAAGERRSWKKHDWKIKLWSFALALSAAYLSVLFLFQPGWPGYGELLKWAYGPAARTVAQWLGSAQ